jgi:hypothetical protein
MPSDRSSREHYDSQGFAFFPGALAENDLLPLIGCIERGVDARARTLHAEGKLTNLHSEEPYDKRLVRLCGGREPGMRSWDEVFDSDNLLALACNPKLLDVLETMLGPDISFSGDFHLRPKLPESRLTSFPWHQDSQYYGAPTRHLHIVTVWVPLVDVDERNGCLWVIPGSQRWGLLKGERGTDMNIRTFEDVEKRGTPQPVPMKRGDLLLFSNLTFHASKLNLTDRVRWSLDLRYIATPQPESMNSNEREALEYYLGKLQSAGRTPVVARGRQYADH